MRACGRRQHSLRRCCQVGSGKTTCGSLNDEIKNWYEWREPASTTRQKLADLHQGSRTLVEHAEEVKKLVTQAYPDVDPHTQDQYAAVAFVRGLYHRRVAFLVLQQAPAILAEAIAFADTCEHNHRATMREDKSRARSCRVSWADDGTDGWSSEEEPGRVRRTSTPSPASTLCWAVGSSQTAPWSRSLGSKDGLAQLETKFEQRLAKLESLLQQALTGNIPFNRDRSASPSSRRGASHQPKGSCYGCGEEKHFKRECFRSPIP